MVSVEPAITDAVLPIKLSGEKLLNKSFNKANEPLPDTGLISASGKISLGNPNALVTGDNKSVNISKNIAYWRRAAAPKTRNRSTSLARSG